ncbi:MAG: hypothetical protein MJ230_04420 [bacterium]|nr:hypothetical protein [bacterium]
MANLFQSGLNWMAKTFSKDTSKMLIITGVAGWALSSLAQIGAILVNPKIKDEQKMFLLPQEFSDAIMNIGAFFLVTQVTKKTVSKLFSTGKFTTKSVRKFLNEHKNVYGDKVGKLDFNIEEALKYETKGLLKSHQNMANLGTTIATVGASILASNVITPILRNKMASSIQKTYLSETNEPKKPEVTTKISNSVTPIQSASSMKI